MGKKLTDLQFTNRLYNECHFLFATVKPEPLARPRFIHVNKELMLRLDLDTALIETPSFLRFCNGDLEFEGLIFGSTVYAGHQFGQYVPQLGDGRAVMIGEIEVNEKFYELQLKGSGRTPFSRRGDGKAVVRSSIREYLASAHLKALQIPTTEALSLIKGEDEVYREEVEKGAIVIRVAESFLRFGHFQYLSGEPEKLKALVEFCIDHYFKTFKDHPNRYVLFFQEIVKKTAKLFAQWQAVGFCHGVLNTDNTSIVGLTIDYGPFGFIEQLDLDHVCNHSDHEGRYSFGNQPEVGHFNLTCLAGVMTGLISERTLERTLQTYAPTFQFEYLHLLRRKCGLFKSFPEDEGLLRDLLNTLVVVQCDYTNFFRALSRYHIGDKLSYFGEDDRIKKWLRSYELRLEKETVSLQDRHAEMLNINPKFILRNYLAQMAIENESLVGDLFKVLSNPFEEWTEHEEWAKPTPPDYKKLIVSCSS